MSRLSWASEPWWYRHRSTRYVCARDHASHDGGPLYQSDRDATLSSVVAIMSGYSRAVAACGQWLSMRPSPRVSAQGAQPVGAAVDRRRLPPGGVRARPLPHAVPMRPRRGGSRERRGGTVAAPRPLGTAAARGLARARAPRACGPGGVPPSLGHRQRVRSGQGPGKRQHPRRQRSGQRAGRGRRGPHTVGAEGGTRHAWHACTGAAVCVHTPRQRRSRARVRRLREGSRVSCGEQTPPTCLGASPGSCHTVPNGWRRGMSRARGWSTRGWASVFGRWEAGRPPGEPAWCDPPHTPPQRQDAGASRGSRRRSVVSRPEPRARRGAGESTPAQEKTGGLCAPSGVAERWCRASRGGAGRPDPDRSGPAGVPRECLAAQPHGPWHGQRPPWGCREAAGGQPGAEGLPCPLRALTCAPQAYATMGGGRSRDAITVGHDAATVPADIQPRVPLRAVAGAAGHLGREEHADLAQRDLREPRLAAFTRLGRGG
jgi:hypothetical protein